MNLGWPQIVIAGLVMMGLGMELARDGKPKTGHYSFGISTVATAIQLWILYMGGFFTTAS